jgi:uncharacterized protein (TIRG00374 family)
MPGHVATARVAAGLLVTLACLVLAFWNVPIGDLADALASAHPGWAAAAALAQVALVAARAWRTRVLLRGRVGYADAFWSQAAGLLVTNLVPLRAGEAARVLLLSRRGGLPLGHTGAVVVVEHALDVLAAIGLLAALLVLMPVPGVVVAAGLALGALVVLACVGLAAAVALRRHAERVAGRVGHVVPRRLRAVVVAQWAGGVDGLATLGSPSVAAGSAGASAAIWLAAIVSFWAAIEAVVPGATWIESAFVIVAISFGAAVPSSPGSVGVFELIGQQALAGAFPARFTPATALASALLAHLLFYLVTVVLGTLALVRLGASLGTLRTAGVRR